MERGGAGAVGKEARMAAAQEENKAAMKAVEAEAVVRLTLRSSVTMA